MLGKFFYGLKYFFEWTFGLVVGLGNIANLIIVLTLIGLLGFWLLQLNKAGSKDTPWPKQGKEIE